MMADNETSLPDEVELVRFREGEGVTDCCAVLEAAGLPYRLSTDVPSLDISSLGGGAVKGSVIIMVSAADEVKARTALLDDARAALTDGVPADYHLREFDDSELQLIVHQPSEWSGYDVAAAELLLRERNVPFSAPSFELTEADIEERKAKVREFNAAHLLLVVLLVAFAVRLAWVTLFEKPAPSISLPPAPASQR